MNIPDLNSILFNMQFWRLITSHLFFTSPGELLFGTLLIYYFRLLERQMGTEKFAV